jgi:hydrogenase-4 component B
MPRTAFCFLIGAVAICGLPPLNGFVSEFLIYLGLFKTLGSGAGSTFAAASFAAPALALIGALAVACFVKVYGAVFLGTARSDHARQACESPWTMIAPMSLLVALCYLIGLAPILVSPILGNAVSAWEPGLKDAGPRLTGLAPLGWVTIMSAILTAGLLVLGVALAIRLRYSMVEKRATWSCGYIAPTPKMQYTSSSFSQILVGLFGWALRPRIRWPKIQSPFPTNTAFQSEVPDTVLDEAVLPVFRFGGWLFSWFRVLQQGSIQTYLLYIFVVLIILLLWR